MFYFVKYIVIALASMSVMQAGLINLPLPRGCPEINFMLTKEMQYTHAEWKDTFQVNVGDFFPHFWQTIPAKLVSPNKEEHHFLTGVNIVLGRLLLELSVSQKASMATLNINAAQDVPGLTRPFSQKFAAGLSVNKQLFLKLNLNLWDEIWVPMANEANAERLVQHFCIHPSILWKTSWFNVDLGFGSDDILLIRTSDAVATNQYQELINTGRAIGSQLPEALNFKTVLSFPIRINISFNMFAFTHQ